MEQPLSNRKKSAEMLFGLVCQNVFDTLLIILWVYPIFFSIVKNDHRHLKENEL